MRDLEARLARRASGCADRGRRRSLLRHGSGQAVGSDRARATTRSSTGSASARRPRSRPSRRPTRGARTTSSSDPTVIDGGRRPDRATASRSSISTSGPTGRASSSHALADPDFDGFDRAAPDGRPAPRRSPRRDDDRVRGGPARRGRLPAGGGPARSRAFSEAGWRQFHVAETEKYAHVTYFFNGGREDAVRRRGALLVPSPRVADVRPPAGDERGRRDRRPRGRDRVRSVSTSSSPTSPTRTWSATPVSGTPRRGASSSSTRCLGRIVEAVERLAPQDPTGPGALLVVTADHGNADEHARPRTATRSPPTRSTPCQSSASAPRSSGADLHDGVARRRRTDAPGARPASRAGQA